MNEDPTQDPELREFVKEDYVWLAEFLRTREGLSIPEIRQLLWEILSVTI